MPPAPLSAGFARRAPALAVAALAAALACGEGGETGGPANAAQFLSQYETSLCSIVASCCNSRELPSRGDACAAAVRRTFAEALFDEAKYAYDRDGGAACLGALSAMPAACGPFADGLFGPGSDFERVCGRVFAPRGSAAPGEPCVAGFECAAPADLDALSSCALGTRPDGGYGRACEVIAYGGEGAPCDTGAAPRRDARPSVTRACKPGGLYCASDGACRARVAEAGLPCEPGACAGGTFCNGQSLCEAKRGVGAPCDDTASACDGAGFCDRATKLCQPRRAEGEPCAGEAECQGACAGGACSAPLPDRSDDYRVLCAHTATPGD